MVDDHILKRKLGVEGKIIAPKSNTSKIRNFEKLDFSMIIFVINNYINVGMLYIIL